MQVLSENEKKMLLYSTNCEEFIKDILGLDVKWFHREWLELFEKHTHIALLAPRGHGKSILVGAYILWRILRNSLVRVLIVTINQDKANEMMGFIQNHLMTNEKLKEIWGDLKDPINWSKTSITVRNISGKVKTHREPTLDVVGVTASMVGGHYDLIILDDITDQKNSRTPGRREDLVRWYNMTLTPMLEPEGKMISIGTKWHEIDIHNTFLKDSTFKSRTYDAIRFEPNEEQLKKGQKPQVLWPERWSYEKLMKIKSQIGSVAFSMQYRNQIVSAEDAIIQWEWLERARNGFRYIEPPYKVYMGVDLASKGTETDFFSLSVIAIKDGFVYLMDGYRGDLSMKNQFKIILEYDRKWRPSKIGVDSAAIQKAITDQLIEDNPTLPIVPIKPSIVNDRMSRVQRLSVLFETNRIFLKPDLVIYADEISMFPRGAHDDTIDSLSFAIQASNIEEESGLDWERMPNLITSRSSKNVGKKISSKKYNVIKV